MILRFEYKSVSRFSPSVKEHAFLLRSKPFVSDNQRIIDFGLEVKGCPKLSEQIDSFGNTIFFGGVKEEHDEFCVLSHGIVETSYCQHVAPYNQNVNTPNPVFLYPSPLVILDDEINDFASGFRASSVETTVKNLCAAVNGKIAYQSDTTDVLTDSLPARYVAGYVRGLRLSHAWTEVYYNGCWHGYDATENNCQLEHYIKIAHGRDASDCPLNRGIFTGTAVENNEIEINVEND